MREVTHEQWKEEGIKLFGKDMDAWKFECPSCGHIAKVSDWKKEGAAGMVAFSCIGRITNPNRDAFVKGKGPCNYAGGGLIGLNPVRVIFPDGKTNDIFEFAKESAVPGATGAQPTTAK